MTTQLIRSACRAKTNLAGLPAGKPPGTSGRRPLPAPVARAIPQLGKRDYLRALRAAEMASWELATGTPRPAAKPAPSPTPRLPRASDAQSSLEDRLFAILTLLALVSVVRVLLESSDLAQHWGRFAELIRQFLG